MSWSITLGSVAGTVLRLHVTFFLLLVWVGAVQWGMAGPEGAIGAIVLVIAAFVCVVLHEFGHVFAARAYGIKTPEITILPIGGLAHLERMPDKPGQELVVAAAGPLVNVVIAALLLGLLGARFDMTEMAEIERAQASFAGQLLAINVILAVFNLIPAFPLDGGRMFRAILGFFMPRVRATQIAARTGQATALLLAVAGLFYNPFLLLISIFIFFAAEAEARHETSRSVASGFVASDAMVSRYESLSEDATAADAAKLLLLTTQQEFPVVDRDGRLAGIVTRKALIETMAETGEATPVREFLAADLPTAGPSTPLGEVLELLSRQPVRAVPVLAPDRKLIGYVSSENVSEFFMLEEARRSRAS